MAPRTPPPHLLGGFTAAPLVVGLAHAAGRALGGAPGWGGLSLYSPFVQGFLAGVLVTFACRPILGRVAWTRPAAVGVAAALWVGLGPVPVWLTARLAALAGLAPHPLALPPTPWPDLLGALAGGAALALTVRGGGGFIGWANLRERWRRRGPRWPAAVAALVLAALALLLAVGALDARGGWPGLVAPLVTPNPWLRLQAAWQGVAVPGDNGAAPLAAAGEALALLRAGAFLLLEALRAAALVAPLVPVALVVRGSMTQLTLMFTILLFTLGDFVPLMLDQPYPSVEWLLWRTALGLLRAGMLGWLTARLLGEVSRPEPAAGSAQ